MDTYSAKVISLIENTKLRLKQALEEIHEKAIPFSIFSRNSGINKDILAALLSVYGNSFEFIVKKGDVYIKLKDKGIIDKFISEAEKKLFEYYENEQ